MRPVRILTAAIVTAAFILFSIPISAEPAGSDLISGTFRCLPSDRGNVMTGEFHYSDSYFSASGKEKNEHLRTMSLDLALTAFGSYTEGDNAVYARELLDKTGFTDISVEQMNEASTADSVGSIIAHKKTPYGEVIAVAVRGGYYGKEWENTLDVGHSGDLKGFSLSAEKMIGRIDAYKTKYSLRNAKLWLTGYSRGGAVCDLAGKRLNENIAGSGMTADDLYIYTFEAPAACDGSLRYENIHNVYADGDIVTMLFPSEWGLGHAGVPEPLGGNDVYIYRKHIEGTSIVDNYNILYSDGSGYIKSVKAAPITVTEFGQEFTGWFAANADREYCASYSPYIARFVSLFTSRTSDEAERLASYIIDAVKGLSAGSLLSFSSVGIILPGGDTYQNSISYLSSELIKAFDAKDHSGVMTNAEYAVFRTDLPFLIKFAVPLIKADMTVADPFTHICTFIGNIDAILLHHRQEYVLPLTESYDTYHCPIPIDGAEIDIDVTTAKVVSVKLGGVYLKEGSEYSSVIKDSAGVIVVPDRSGKYTAEVTGVGGYSGTAEKTFTAVFPHYHDWAFSSFGDIATVKCVAYDCDDYITGKAYTVRVLASDKTYDGKVSEIGLDIADGFPSELSVGSPVVYNEKGREAEPLEPGKYTAEVTISDKETGESSDAKLIFKISPIDLERSVTETVFEENSAEILSFSCGGKILTEGTDYKVYYRSEDGTGIEKPEKAGQYVAVISGEGRYSGKIREEFEIKTVINIPLIAALSAVAAAAAAGTVIFVKRRKKA